MKKTYIIYSLLLIAGVLNLISCDHDLDINVDPDLLTPEQVPMAAELPTAQTGIAAAAGTYFAIPGGFWSQFWTQSAVANQYRIYDNYSVTNSSTLFNDGWSQIYDALTDIRNIKANAKTDSNWNYYLIASTLEAYAFQLLIDFYGSVPYTDANNTAILAPSFQSAEEVYDLMVSDLKEALSKNLANSPLDNVPGETDLLFEGDMEKWAQFANTLLLRLYLRQSNARPTVASSGVTELINSGASFLNESAAITQFVDEASRSNPLYENEKRQLNVGTNLRASNTMGSFLEAATDPRLAEFYDGNTFQLQGDFGDGSGDASVVVLHATDPFYFISEAESKFLQAEAYERYSEGTEAQGLYEEGVLAAFAQFGLDGSDMLATNYAYPNSNDEEANIKAIITQKWISLYPGSGFEAFIEHNRTGYPQISPVVGDDNNYVPGEFTYSVEGTTGGLFPKRFLFPLDETQRNPNTPAQIPLTEKVWYAN
ncbi:SusD/RagB family nutrient-binding outer membrane lipoprotein [Flagellimonas algicola]|uniref:SusD/RagB family nutrient-binding outer membrane lipoprotein n=1 Tax=Flagellimonas algicola TaxID=2583815 RepID=A0ABY2WMH4_9FLAO|nr:SusD/RagB family nutrient-binding outer membrane lipoprotein [Allomuricauda algicola]TMU55579.1 SusD/RagB family nutrient-binding outer membrane lipoprotein [Allomuricauda algicola]